MRILGVVFTCLVLTIVAAAEERTNREVKAETEKLVDEQNNSVRNTVIGGTVLGGNFLANSLINNSQSTILQNIAEEKEKLNQNAAIRNSKAKNHPTVKNLKAKADVMRSTIATQETKLRNRSYGQYVNITTGLLAIGTVAYNGVKAYALGNEINEIIECHPELLTGENLQPISKHQQGEYRDLVKPIAIILEEERN